jgi:hypothetical protein
MEQSTLMFDPLRDLIVVTLVEVTHQSSIRRVGFETHYQFLLYPS